MVGALLWLVCVLLIAGIIYYLGLLKLWPLFPAGFTGSTLGKVIYIILVLVLALCVVVYGVIPVVEAIPGTFGGAPFRRF